MRVHEKPSMQKGSNMVREVPAPPRRENHLQKPTLKTSLARSPAEQASAYGMVCTSRDILCEHFRDQKLGQYKLATHCFAYLGINGGGGSSSLLHHHSILRAVHINCSAGPTHCTRNTL